MRIKLNKKKLLLEYVNYTCEMCNKVYKLNKLSIHRIRRGNQGGTYEFRNCKVLCMECHKKIHGNEFNHIKGK